VSVVGVVRAQTFSSSRRLLHVQRAICVGALWCAGLLLSPPVSAGEDPGIVIELDRRRYRATIRDLRSGEEGPSMPIALGSPANPTPDGRFRFAWVILRPA